MFLKNQLAKGRPVVLPIEIKTFQCMNTIQIRINLFVKFFTLSKNKNNPYQEKAHDKAIFLQQNINITINVIRTDVQEEYPADSLNVFPALIESRIESIANLET